MKRSARLAAAVAGCWAAAVSAETRLPDHDAIQARLWAMETAAARGASLPHSRYFRPSAAGWSARAARPLGARCRARAVLGFVAMAYNGHTAVMMFTARCPDAARDMAHFEVTDTWSRAGGTWQLLSTRAQPVEPPAAAVAP